MQALFERERTRRGQGWSVSLFSSAAEIMAVPLLQYTHTGKGPGPAGLSHPSIAPYGSYSAGDGRALLLSVQNEREWEAL
jgi:itaconate CoA-transferase